MKLSQVIGAHVKAIAQAHMDLDIELREVWHDGFKIVITTLNANRSSYKWFLFASIRATYEEVYDYVVDHLKQRRETQS